jgi:hypothetical protein
MLPSTAPIDRPWYVFRREILRHTIFNLHVSGILNVITDLMLIALPIPILILVKRSTVE